MGQVQYPGVMSPGGVLDIDIIPAPGGSTAFFYDDSFLDPIQEWIFEPWVLIVDTTPLMAPQFFTAVDMVEQDHGTIVPDIAGMDSQIVAILVDKGIYDYAAFVPEDDSTFLPEFSFERWIDVQTVTVADAPPWAYEADPAQDDTAIQAEAYERWEAIPEVITVDDAPKWYYDTAQLPNPEIFPETDDLMMEVWAVFEDAGVFLFTDTILEDDDRVPPVMEWSLEPWTDLTEVNLADAPLWAYEADPAQDDSTFLPEFSFEPWLDTNAANPADAPLWAYEADPAQDDSTFLPEFWFEPWSDVQTITTADVPKFDYDTSQIPGVEYDQDYTIWNTWADEPWTDQPAPVVPTDDALWLRCTFGFANTLSVTIGPATSLETIMTIAGTQLTAREVDIGQKVRIRGYFRDEDGNLQDPTSVYFSMRADAVRTTTTLTYGGIGPLDANLVKEATGTYRTDIDTWESGGRWEWNMYSLGTGQAADHDYFQVKPTIAL